MVLVTNEWQNKCEDVPKTTANTTTTLGTYSTTAATTSSDTSTTASIADPSASIPRTDKETNTKSNQYKSETVAADFINSITVTDSTISTSTATEILESTRTILNRTLVNDNANNEQINELIKDTNSIEIAYKNKLNDDDDINECEIGEVENSFTSAKQLKGEDNLVESVLNYNNSIKIMAENTKESPLKEEKEEEDSECQTFIKNQYAGNNKDIDESNTYLSSNNNTLTAPSIKVITQHNNQQPNIITQPQLPLSYPMTTHALSSALQSALNATNKANNASISVAAAGLQPNFLSQLALTANVAGLQKSTTTAVTILTPKQLNQSFNMLDSCNQKQSDSNLLEGTTSVPAVTYENNGQAKIVLICESNSHPFQTRTISLTPNVECMVGRLIAKSKASENNAIFDCKVLSRKHAVIWYTPDGKFWVKDTKSSNGTFINDNKLGDEEAELHFGDIVKYGVDVLENSRKEVHGCIIACVKLYMPDGREAISIDSSAHRSQYSGEGRISYDELHRLNLYIQETTQREKVLTSKLCNIQNVLDATRKNSSLCWQSMITEDQLLHRIHSLEKKLQFMEKNVPENILRNEVLKLLDDKNAYQHTAKEALRKVYQERCDAMQMLAKMESAYTQSDNECSLLRDQIMNSKQTLQDVNTRLLCLETEYNEYKDEVARQQQEAKDREELRITELTEKLREREMDSEDLKKKISELLIKRAELIEDEEQLLEKQAIEKLDAAIADMDLSDDKDSSDECEENDDVDVKQNENKEDEAKEENDVMEQDSEAKFAIITRKPTIRPQLASIFGNKLNGVGDKHQQNKSKLEEVQALDASRHKLPPKRVKETTIMKWLQNSDLNKNEGSFDIFKAICNENENDDEYSEDCAILTDEELKETKRIPMENSSDSEVESLTMFSPVNSSLSVTVIDGRTDSTNDVELLERLKEYQSQVEELKEKQQRTELEAQHTLEIMQIECDDVKLKMENLNKIIEVLKNDKMALEEVISNKQINAATLETASSSFEMATKACKENGEQLEKELELEEDPVLNAINGTALEREEELITYKERLDDEQRQNIDLRNEIALLKLKSNAETTKYFMLKQYLPYGVIILAIIIYFVTTYY